jgi:hypothetical protein
MNTSDVSELSHSWAEPELAEGLGDFVRRNGRLPKRSELEERLHAMVARSRSDAEAIDEMGVVISAHVR